MTGFIDLTAELLLYGDKPVDGFSLFLFDILL